MVNDIPGKHVKSSFTQLFFKKISLGWWIWEKTIDVMFVIETPSDNPNGNSKMN